MAKFERSDLEVRYELFNKFALDDQRSYYKSTLAKYRLSAKQVNRLRALFAFLTGLSAAAAGFIVQWSFVTGARCNPVFSGDTVPVLPADCDNLKILVYIFMISAVVMPVLGQIFNTLADLYQWDRMITIYDSALENIEVADAQSPLPDMDDVVYAASVRAFAEGTLVVMSDETAQWGQSIRTPPQLERFITEQRERAQRTGGDAEYNAERERTGGQPPPPPQPPTTPSG
jgi:hypothetical protein